MPRLAPLVAVAVLVAGCGVPDDAEPTPASPEPTPLSSSVPGPGRAEDPAPAYSTWELGARVLPLRADGFGEVRPTPPSLRERRYPTRDVLPPPSGAGFASTVEPITPAILRRMGETYAPGCPVGPGDLRYVTVTFRGYDGAAHTGELVVAEAEAAGVVSVFRALFRVDFPIEEMRLVTTADLDAAPTGDGNNTGAFVCRPTRGSTSTLSAHAYGLAIDLNPFANPYQRDDLVLPELAGSYLDRADRRPGMVLPGSVAVREFARIGWSWGGDFQSLKDYQHFTATGR